MAKASFFGKHILKKFSDYILIISTIFSLFLIFVDIPTENKLALGIIFLVILFLLYSSIWFGSNNLSEINLDAEGSIATVKTGNLFRQGRFKVITFNEYSDTQISDVIISYNSLNGLYTDNCLAESVSDLDHRIPNHQFEEDELLEVSYRRKVGRT